MIKLRSSLVLCGTICAVIVLALTMSAMTYGSSFQLLSHGPTPPPDGSGDNGGNIVAHGPTPPPDGSGDNGGNIVAHGPTPPPDGSGDNGGNLRLV